MASCSQNLDKDSFDALADLAYRESGLQLMPEKKSMIQSRLRHRVTSLGLNNFNHYADFVCSKDGTVERRQMISALTTNVSHFFREKHHFDLLVESIRVGNLEKLTPGTSIRIWSAGCSNGQEVYSIAMCLLENFPSIENCNLRILGTDIDPQVIKFAQAGVYPKRLVTGVPNDLLRRYFIEHECQGEITYSVNDKLKSFVVFRELNLLSDWPIKRKMDAIFCRNVVIYFDVETQSRLWPRFSSVLAKNGYLFLGHSERIADPRVFAFENDGPTTYRASASR